MIVTGLNSNRYLTGNPIPITIRPDIGTFAIGTKVTISIMRQATHLNQTLFAYSPITLYPKPDGLQIDLAPYLIGMMPEPYIPTNTYQDPVPNYQVFNINFTENQSDTSAIFLNKTFIRAFERTRSTSGITFPTGKELREGERIPVWEGYPTARFYIDSSSRIMATTVVEAEHIKRMRTPNACDPFYIRFMNTKGGYSFWMFNVWEDKYKTKALGTISNTIGENKSLGFTDESVLTVETRVRREYYDLIRALTVSPVVQVYNKFGSTWTKIELKGTTFNTNNYDDLQEFTCDFDLMLNTNPSVIW